MTEFIVFLLAVTQVATIAAGFVFYRKLQERTRVAGESQMEHSLRTSVGELLAELEASTERAAQGIARQRTTLTELLREADRRIQLLPDGDDGAGEVEPVVEAVTRGVRRAAGWQNVAVRLAGDGLSEAAIARQLRVGLEEVRLTLATKLPGSA